MADIRLNDGTINVGGEWLSAKDLIKRIQEKLDTKDMALKNLVSALEELTTANENYHTLEVRLAITKEKYEKLRAIGGEDDQAILRKAIDTLIGKADENEPKPMDDRIFDIVSDSSSDEQEVLLDDFGNRQFKELRRYPRKECFLTVNYTAKGRVYQNFIKNISVSGAFIETKERFFVGEEILLTISYSNDHRPFKISGEVVRVNGKGVGVAFKNVSKVQEVMINSIIQKPD